MRPAIPYLTFPGTCRTAMSFYADVLGGEVTTLVTFADAPIDVPEAPPEQVFNAEVRAGDLVLKASDGRNDSHLDPSIAVFLTLDDRASMQSILDRLATGGTVLFPADGAFGMVEDRFGVRWMATHVDT